MTDQKDMDLAVEEIVNLINSKINIPYIPEDVEQVIIRAIVLAIIHILSKKAGKKKKKTLPRTSLGFHRSSRD